MARRYRGYTLVELIVIILMIAVGTTLILSIHTKMQRDALDTNDRLQVEYFAERLRQYAGMHGGLFPSVETYNSEPDRISRFSDFRQRPGKTLRILIRTGKNSADASDFRMLYSPMDGAMPDSLLESMSGLASQSEKCYSSYSYDPGHKKDIDGTTVIFGHSPSFLRRHGRNRLRVINASTGISEIPLNPETGTYSIPVRVPTSQQPIGTDAIFEDQATTLFNRDSYLNDLIPFR